MYVYMYDASLSIQKQLDLLLNPKHLETFKCTFTTQVNVACFHFILHCYFYTVYSVE